MQTVIQWDDDEPQPRSPAAVLRFPDPSADDDAEPLSPELEDELARILAAALVSTFRQDVRISGSPPGIPRPEQNDPQAGPIRRGRISKVDGE